MIDEKKLEERLVALEAAKSWSPRVVSRLETLLRSGADETLYRINPLRFAADKSIADAEAVDLFLHACVAGLFDMDWLLICPTCSDVVESFRSLRTLHSHFHCTLCQTDYEAALDDFIAVTFTVSPAVRGIRFHTPDSLSAWDYAFVYRWSPGGVLPDGVPWSEVCRSLTKVMERVAPCSAVDFEIDAAAGAILGIHMDSDAEFLFPVEGEAVVGTRRIPITLDAQHEASFIDPLSAPHRVGADAEYDERRRDVNGADRVGQPIRERRAEDDLKPVVREKTPIDQVVTGGRLHPAIGGKNPERREQRPRGHQHGGDEMNAWQYKFAAKQQCAKERRFQEKGRQTFVGQ